MPKKKKLTKAQKREQRKRKAAQWLATYSGGHVVRAYRKKFNVDTTCALRELEELGCAFSDQEKRNLLNGSEAQAEYRHSLLGTAEENIFLEVTAHGLCRSDEAFLALSCEDGTDCPSHPHTKQGLPKNWKGHYCKVCKRRLANERFSGKGHKAHICKECASRLKAERKAANKVRQEKQE